MIHLQYQSRDFLGSFTHMQHFAARLGGGILLAAQLQGSRPTKEEAVC
jgi:hypothetical protein